MRTIRRPTTPGIPEHVGLLVLARSRGYCEGCALGRPAAKYHRRGTIDHDETPANWLHLCLPCVDLVEVSPALANLHLWNLCPGDDPHEEGVMWRNRRSRLTAGGKVEQRRVGEDVAWRAI